LTQSNNDASTFGQIEAKPPSSQEIDCEKNDVRKHAQSAAVPNSQISQKVNLSLQNQPKTIEFNDNFDLYGFYFELYVFYFEIYSAKLFFYLTKCA
jgi:hypothetical protein